MAIHENGGQRYRLENLQPGNYLVFALAGRASNVFPTLNNPYELVFRPIALGIREVEVKKGVETEVDLELRIDLREGAGAVAVNLDELPVDPLTQEELPNGLMLPVIDTGKGFVFVDIDGSYNVFENADGSYSPYDDEHERPSPLLTEVVFPNPDDPVLKALALTLDPLVVGLAGRKAYRGADPPGISTAIRHVWAPAPTVDYAQRSSWPQLPLMVEPAPPDNPQFIDVGEDELSEEPVMVVDAVGGTLTDGRIAWDFPTDTPEPDIFVVRINYMTPGPVVPIVDTSLGGARSHALWEFYVRGDQREMILPELPRRGPPASRSCGTGTRARRARRSSGTRRTCSRSRSTPTTWAPRTSPSTTTTTSCSPT